MPRFLVLPLACLLAVSAAAAPMPLTSSEITLMLRAGYSSRTVLQEVAKRKFADTLDPTKETQLIHAGASPELLIALKSGSYNMSTDEVAAINQRKENEAKRRALAAENARQFNTLYQAQVEKDRAANTIRQKVDQQLVYQLVKGDLVQWRNGAVSRFDDAALQNKKLFLIYFSAHWCKPCRMLTPGLVNYYNEMSPKHPEFDLIFVSRDKSPFGMETYMRETNMPWPAIDFEKVPEKQGILKYAGEGIPDLVLVDGTGKVLADSFEGGQYVGPEKVLAALDKIFANGAPKDVAQTE